MSDVIPLDVAGYAIGASSTSRPLPDSSAQRWQHVIAQVPSGTEDEMEGVINILGQTGYVSEGRLTDAGKMAIEAKRQQLQGQYPTAQVTDEHAATGLKLETMTRQVVNEPNNNQLLQNARVLETQLHTEIQATISPEQARTEDSATLQILEAELRTLLTQLAVDRVTLESAEIMLGGEAVPLSQVLTNSSSEEQLRLLIYVAKQQLESVLQNQRQTAHREFYAQVSPEQISQWRTELLPTGHTFESITDGLDILSVDAVNAEVTKLTMQHQQRFEQRNQDIQTFLDTVPSSQYQKWETALARSDRNLDTVLRDLLKSGQSLDITTVDDLIGDFPSAPPVLLLQPDRLVTEQQYQIPNDEHALAYLIDSFTFSGESSAFHVRFEGQDKNSMGGFQVYWHGFLPGVATGTTYLTPDGDSLSAAPQSIGGRQSILPVNVILDDGSKVNLLELLAQRDASGDPMVARLLVSNGGAEFFALPSNSEYDNFEARLSQHTLTGFDDLIEFLNSDVSSTLNPEMLKTDIFVEQLKLLIKNNAQHNDIGFYDIPKIKAQIIEVIGKIQSSELSAALYNQAIEGLYSLSVDVWIDDGSEVNRPVNADPITALVRGIPVSEGIISPYSSEGAARHHFVLPTLSDPGSSSSTIVFGSDNGIVLSSDSGESVPFGLDYSNQTIPDSNFQSSQVLRRTNFSNSVLTGSQFQDSDIRSADFSHSSVERVNFDRANAESVDFSGADLEGASLMDTNLHGVNLDGANLHAVTINIRALATVPEQYRDLFAAQGATIIIDGRPSVQSNPTPPVPGRGPILSQESSDSDGLQGIDDSSGFTMSTDISFPVRTNPFINPNGLINPADNTQAGHQPPGNSSNSITAVADNPEEPNQSLQVINGEVVISGIRLPELDLGEGGLQNGDNLFGVSVGLPGLPEYTPAPRSDATSATEHSISIPVADTSTQSTPQTPQQQGGVTIGGQLGNDKGRTAAELGLDPQGVMKDPTKAKVPESPGGYGEGVNTQDLNQTNTRDWGDGPVEPDLVKLGAEGFPQKDKTLEDILNPEGPSGARFRFPPGNEETPAAEYQAVIKTLPALQQISVAEYSQLSSTDQKNIISRAVEYQSLPADIKANTSLLQYADSGQISATQRSQMLGEQQRHTVHTAQQILSGAQSGLSDSTVQLINTRMDVLQQNTAALNQQTQVLTQSNANRQSALATSTTTDPVTVAFIKLDIKPDQTPPASNSTAISQINSQASPIPRFMVVRTANGPQLMENLANGKTQMLPYPIPADTSITRQSSDGGWRNVPDAYAIGAKNLLDTLLLQSTVKMLNGGNAVKTPGVQNVAPQSPTSIPQPAF